MQHRFIALVAIAAAFLVSACTVVTVAPGANQIRLATNPTDVAKCTAVGNIEVPKNSDGVVDLGNAQKQFRNQAIGFGGNAGLVTEGRLDVPSTGIAYHCP